MPAVPQRRRADHAPLIAPRTIRSAVTVHLDTIRARVREAGADALWVHPSVDFRYLTGLELLSIERPAGLLIPATGEVRAAAPAMFAEPLAGIDAVLWTDADGPEEAISRVLGGVRRLLVGPSLPTGQAFLLRRVLPGLELELDPGIVAALRRRKAPEEIELLAEAGRLADEAVAWIGTLDLWLGRLSRRGPLCFCGSYARYVAFTTPLGLAGRLDVIARTHDPSAVLRSVFGPRYSRTRPWP
jgi:hypothetical protein